jgi:hypothetical protein
VSDDGQNLLLELLEAPDRDHCPGARPVVAYRDDDDPAYLSQLDAGAVDRIALQRRGQWHGQWAQLAEEHAPAETFPLEGRLHQRWDAACPVLLRGLVDPAEARQVGRERGALFEALAEPGGLRSFLRAAMADAPHNFELASPQDLSDGERDIERHAFTWRADPERAGSPVVRDLWAKSAWLSTHGDDRSLRLRVAFGAEGADDASRDGRKHRRVAELGEVLLPELALLSGDESLRARLDAFAGEPTFLTQPIAYWNAPNGGARFHHDAFDEERVGGQLGVCYVQLGGRTAWLALSTADLAQRVAEVADYLEEGELGWIRESLWPRGQDFERFLALARHPKRCPRELTRPGCGSLGPLVDRGPEFTALLADAGHGLVLEPGDVLLLPNHGLDRTCMHSVFCASVDEVAYGLSAAVRTVALPDPPPRTPRSRSVTRPDPDQPMSLRRQREQRRRRR